MKTNLSRREILQVAALTTGAAISARSDTREGGQIPATPNADKARPVQERYRATVPDTLDLAGRAELAINGLAGTLDWEHGPEFYFRVTLAPPTMVHDGISFCACGPKYFESFPMMRLMTGGNLYNDIERQYRDYMIRSIAKDGFFYAKIGPDRPWDKTSPEDYANVYGQGRMIRAMLAHYYCEHDPEWMERLAKMVNKLQEIAVYRDDYVCYPTCPGYGDFFSYPKSGWKIPPLRRGPDQGMGDLPDYTFGYPMYLGGTLLPLVRYAEAARDEKALDFAGKLARFLMKAESGWIPDGYPKGMTPGAHGYFRGHFHGHTMALRGILAYGVATNDAGLKIFARDAYEFARTMGIARLGWFEEVTGKHSHETCGLGNMVALGIQLSEAGVGDYWDDVDGYVRNHLVEAQFTDLARLRKLNSSLSVTQEQMLDRSIGTFAGWGTPVALSTVLMNCCMANGSQALYYPWESSVRFSNGTARVNLLLNRASPWLDVDSYLPYEGKLVLYNKQAERILVRIPGWVDQQSVRCEVNGAVRTLVFAGNYLLVEPVQGNSTVTLSFPQREEAQRFVLDDYGQNGDDLHIRKRYTYDIVFRGSTALKVTGVEETKNSSPGEPAAVPIYDAEPVPAYAAYQDREQFRKTSAPMKSVERVVTDTHILSW